MRCFIHNESEAIATCKTCGKAMCAKCSAYSSHTGICPECRRDQFKKEIVTNENTMKELKWERVKNIFFAIILCWTIICLIVNLYYFSKNGEKIEELENRNDTLAKEILKLDKALKERGTKAFV